MLNFRFGFQWILLFFFFLCFFMEGGKKSTNTTQWLTMKLNSNSKIKHETFRVYICATNSRTFVHLVQGNLQMKMQRFCIWHSSCHPTRFTTSGNYQAKWCVLIITVILYIFFSCSSLVLPNGMNSCTTKAKTFINTINTSYKMIYSKMHTIVKMCVEDPILSHPRVNFTFETLFFSLVFSFEE